MRGVGSSIPLRSGPWVLPLSRPPFEVVLHPSTYLVYWIGPVIDDTRANLVVTMEGGI
jgi:hypothetical protein